MTTRTRPYDVRYGPGAIGHLPAVLESVGARRALLVCGRTSLRASGAATVLPSVEKSTQLAIWDDFQPNPDVADLARGLHLLDRVDPAVVIGIGGGSAMDMAKLLCAFADEPRSGLRERVANRGPVDDRELGLILAPTTSGSGSEATHFAVVYVGERKYSIAGTALYPDTALLDPKLATSGSAYQRATSGIDAVCQSIESMWATGATVTSRRYARHALQLLLGAIESFVREPTLPASRAMCIGSHLAGRAIDISKTTAAHALSYAITKRYGVEHGNAVALTLGHFIELHAAGGSAPDRLQPQADPQAFDAAMATILGELRAPDGPHARRAFTDLLQRLGLVSRLSDAGIRTADERSELAAGVNVERLANNPVALTPADLLDVLGRA